MATETVASPQIPATDDEQGERKVTTEEKNDDEQDTISLTKKSEEEITKTEDSLSLETPPKSEAVDHEKIEPPVVEAEKTVDVPVSDVPVVDETKVENNPVPHIPEPVSDAVNIPEELESSTESVVRKAPKEAAMEIIEEGQVEQPKIVDAPQPSYEAIEKPEEPLEVTSDKESVETVVKEIEDSEPGSLEVQEPELAVAEVDEKPGEPSELTSEVEKKLEEVELEKSVQDETVKDEGSGADMVESIPILEKGKTEADDTPTLEVEEAPEHVPKVKEEEKTLDEVGPETSVEDGIVKDEGSAALKVEDSLEEEQTDKNDEPSEVPSPEEVLLNRDGADYSLPDAPETVAAEEQKKELNGVDVVEKLPEEAAVEIEKVGGEIVEAKETEKEIVATENSTEPFKETKKEGLNGIDAGEKLAEEAAVKLGTVGEENVEKLEIEEKEKSNVVTEESTQPIKEDEKKELNGLDVVEKLAEEAAVELEKVGEKNVEAEEDEKKSAITEVGFVQDEKKELSGADVYEKLADETAVKLEEVEEEDVGKISETEESEKKNEIIGDSSRPILADQKKELSGVDVVEKLAEDAPVESEKVIDEVSTQQDKADVNSTIIIPSEVTEKSFEGAGKDVEPAAENEKAEHIKDETPGTVETKKEDYVEEKQDEVTTLVTETLGESQPSEPEVKGEEPVELEKAIEEVAKSDRNLELPTKDGDDTKASEDQPKEAPAKPSQKQSNTILSKVKQTLVKAKRVITGKSPSSKTPASETKEDIKVK